MKKILIVVDYQFDFVDPNGALPVPNADKISDNIQERINSDEYENIIYTFDTHTPADYEGSDEQKLFPIIHCEYKTEGWDFYKIKPNNEAEFRKKLADREDGLNDTIEHPFKMIQAGNEFFFTKDVFDIWVGNANYPKWFVEKFPADEYEIDVVGVAYEFCVAQNILGMLNRGYKVNLINNCVTSITIDGEKEACKVMSDNGLNFI